MVHLSFFGQPCSAPQQQQLEKRNGQAHTQMEAWSGKRLIGPSPLTVKKIGVFVVPQECDWRGLFFFWKESGQFLSRGIFFILFACEASYIHHQWPSVAELHSLVHMVRINLFSHNLCTKKTKDCARSASFQLNCHSTLVFSFEFAGFFITSLLSTNYGQRIKIR